MRTKMGLQPRLLAIGALFVCWFASVGQENAWGAAMDYTWKASWITSQDAPHRDECVLRFRKQLVLEATPARYVVHVSADNQYLFLVNGKFVGIGPSAGDIAHWKYETYDIAPMLHAGTNQIAATVWNFGENAPLRQITDRIGFLIDGDTSTEMDIRSDTSWEVAVEKGISTLPVPDSVQNFYYVGSPGELLNGHSLLWDWSRPESEGHHVSVWKKASIIAPALAKGAFALDLGAAWQLIPDNLPPMERTEQEPGKVVRVTGLASAGDFPQGRLKIPAHSDVSILIDRGYLTTAYPELEVNQGGDANIRMTYAEALYDDHDQKGNRNEIEGRHILGVVDEIHPDDEPLQDYMPLDWRTWRYLQIDVKAGNQPVELRRLHVWFTAYPFKKIASFTADRSSLTSMWDIGWRTARLCAHDTYVDTPYWERIQYTGDTRIQALISYVVSGDDRLAHQAIEALHNSVTPEGIPLSRYPASSFQSIPGFSLHWIGMVHDFWMYRNDSQFVRAQLPVVRTTLEWFRDRLNADQLVGHLPYWPFVDWANDFENGVPPQTSNGDSSIQSLQLVAALRDAAEMEASLGNVDLATQDTDEAARIANAVYELCWDKNFGLLADTPERNHFSQHANALAVWLDVIPHADQAHVMQAILSASDPSFTSDVSLPKLSRASFYYRFYLSRALVHSGLGDRYLETLGPWTNMIAKGLTTWAETPEPTRSDSHAWSAHPTYDLLTIVAGISPASPGFTTVRIEPHLGALHHLDATLPSPSGAIHTMFDIEGDELHAQITLPEGMNGKFFWNGSTHALTPGMQELRLPLPRSGSATLGSVE